MIEKDCLYLSYTSMTEPLGKSQVLQYLESLETSSDIHLFSFENNPDQAEVEEIESRIDSQMIEWHHIERSSGPMLVSTIIDLIFGFLYIMHLNIKFQFDIVHARSYIPMTILLPLGVTGMTNIIFDIRGFWIDERADSGSITKGGLLYIILKLFEHLLFNRSDVVISLTSASKNIITEKYHIDSEDVYVIPTCVDTEKFAPNNNSTDDQFQLGYVGTVNEWHLFDEVLDTYHILSEQVDDTKLKIYNKGDVNYIQKKIEKYPHSLPNVSLKSVSHSEMPEKYTELDAGIFFYRSTFSKKATCPTKMGEFLATGTPCLGNCGIGDVGEVLETNNVGIAISKFSQTEKRDAVESLISLTEDPQTSQRCRNVALNQLSLQVGTDKLQTIYTDL